MKPALGTSMSGRIATGAAMLLAVNAVARVFGIINVTVLGRLLDPSDFGLLALALIVVGFTEVLMNRQFELALVRMPMPTQAHFDTVFTMMAIWGVICAVSIAALSGPLAVAFGEPQLAPTLLWMMLVPLIDSLRNPYFVENERALSFGPMLKLNVFSRIATTVAGLSLAFLWRDHWALVAAAITFVAARMLATYFFSRRNPRLSLAHWREFIAFGGWLTGAGFFQFLNQKTDMALVGARLGPQQTGLLHMGSELATMVTTQLAQPLASAAYPALSSFIDDAQRVRAAYLKAQSTVIALLAPVGVGLVFTAHEALSLLVGPKWLDAAGALQVIAPALAFASLALTVQMLAMARGATREIFIRNVVVFAIQLPLTVGGLWLFGFIGAVCARAMGQVALTLLTLRLGATLTGDTFASVLRVCWRSFAASLAMAVVLLLATPVQPDNVEMLSVAATFLAIKVALAAPVYVCTHAALWALCGKPDGPERLILQTGERILRRLRGTLPVRNASE